MLPLFDRFANAAARQAGRPLAFAVALGLVIIWAILGPPVVLLVLIGLMAVEGDYTESTRLTRFSEPIAPAGHGAEAEHGAEAAH